MKPTDQFHLAIRREDGSYKTLTGYPMSHAECCVMKSKYSPEEQSRILFQTAQSDPDHFLTNPMGNHEAAMRSEINRLERENEQLKIKLSRMCGDA